MQRRRRLPFAPNGRTNLINGLQKTISCSSYSPNLRRALVCPLCTFMRELNSCLHNAYTMLIRSKLSHQLPPPTGDLLIFIGVLTFGGEHKDDDRPSQKAQRADNFYIRLTLSLPHCHLTHRLSRLGRIKRSIKEDRRQKSSMRTH